MNLKVIAVIWVVLASATATNAQQEGTPAKAASASRRATVPKKWGVGELLSVERKRHLYYYIILDETCRWTASSSKRLNVVQGASLKYAVVDETIFIADRYGRTQILNYVMHESLPPPPVTRPSPFLVGAGPTAQITASRGEDDTKESCSSLDYEEYARVLSLLFPNKVEQRPFPEGARFVVVGFARDAYQLSEFWFLLQADYKGTVTVVAKVPLGGSVSRQLCEFRKIRPSATKDELMADLRIPERRFTEKQLPELRGIVRDFEKIRISPEMPDSLFSDPYTYDLWSQSLWGQEMSVRLYWPGPDAKWQQPAIVEWIERVRSAVVSQAK